MLQREHKGKRVIIYPAYIDSRLSRGRGRRVPKNLAVKAPTAEEIARAAREMGLEAYVEEGAYPRAWWLGRKRVVVEKKNMSKTVIIRKIAEKLVQKRAARR